MSVCFGGSEGEEVKSMSPFSMMRCECDARNVASLHSRAKIVICSVRLTRPGTAQTIQLVTRQFVSHEEISKLGTTVAKISISI